MTPTPSPNFDERALPVSMIVLHYTGMHTAAAALERLRDPAAKVSAHYCVDEDGTVHALVAEEKRAWHAGRSHWRGVTDINSASVGIEIVNPGHEFGYRDFPDAQIDALIPLVAAIKERHGVQARPRRAVPLGQARPPAPGAAAPDPESARPGMDRGRLPARAGALRL